MDPGNLLLVVVIALTGAGLTVQTAMNARLRAAVHQPLAAASISFIVGLLLLLALTATGWMGRPRVSGLHHAPWWAWIGGAFGAAYITVALIGAPRIGVAVLTAAVVCGQLVAALVVDTFGLMGLPRIPLDGWRVGGAALLVVAVLLLQRR